LWRWVSRYRRIYDLILGNSYVSKKMGGMGRRRKNEGERENGGRGRN
jgi:hypothetical protein